MSSKTLEILKKSPYLFLAGGASLIIGLLSFSGMFALIPLWPLAIATMGLAVAYEFEIYGQNIKGAFDKLFFVKNYLQNYLMKEFLRENFPKQGETDCQFFEDYLNLTRELENFEHKHLDKTAKNKKRIIENSLHQLEQAFRRQLFSNGKEEDELYPGLKDWLASKGDKQAEYKKTLKSRSQLFRIFMVFGIASAAFMTLGSTFLLSEALAAIPFLTAVAGTMPPVALLLMAVVAGVSYGFLTYNAVTDMVNNKTIQKFGKALLIIKNEGLSWRNLGKTLGAVIVVGLAVALTLCTAGTWWTVAKETAPLFTWLSKIPNFVMGIINPIVQGFSALVFNLENTHATLKLIEATKKTFWAWLKDEFAELKTLLSTLPQRENWGQILNPFRLILVLIAPLRCLLFLAHLVSIAVSGDRLPGIPEIATTLVGFFAEGFEDAHYFMPHGHHDEALTGEALAKAEQDLLTKAKLNLLTKAAQGILLNATERAHNDLLEKERQNTLSAEEILLLNQANDELLVKAKLDEENQALIDERLSPGHSHSHDNDFPTWVLKACFWITLIYPLAILWNWRFSQLNSSKTAENVGGRHKLSWAEAMARQTGHAHENYHSKEDEPRIAISMDSQKAIARLSIEEYQEEHFGAIARDRKIADNKKTELGTLHSSLKTVNSADDLKDNITKCANSATITTNRNLFWGTTNKASKTSTSKFLTNLADDFNVFEAPSVASCA